MSRLVAQVIFGVLALGALGCVVVVVWGLAGVLWDAVSRWWRG